jgi:membrane protease YdiL (CAAX protease family)
LVSGGEKRALLIRVVTVSLHSEKKTMNLTWHPHYFEPVFAVCSFIVLYIVYHYNFSHFLIRAVSAILKNLFHVDTGNRVHILLERAIGFVLFGLIPFLSIFFVLEGTPYEYGFALVENPLFYVSALILCALLFPVLLAFSKTPEAEKNSPLSCPEGLTAGLVIWHVFSRVLYLTGYEFLIRGYLLFTLARFMNAWPAIFVVTALYTCIHIEKGKGEAIGSFLMGIVFGLLALMSGSVLIPLLVHAYIAVVVDILVLRQWKKKCSGQVDDKK